MRSKKKVAGDHMQRKNGESMAEKKRNKCENEQK